jgi:hypothetical protein
MKEIQAVVLWWGWGEGGGSSIGSWGKQTVIMGSGHYSFRTWCEGSDSPPHTRYEPTEAIDKASKGHIMALFGFADIKALEVLLL